MPCYRGLHCCVQPCQGGMKHFFLLVAAWVDPGRSALQSAEQRCQRRYGQIHRVEKSLCDKNMQKGHQNTRNRNLNNFHKRKKEENHPRKRKRCRRGLWWSQTDSTYAGAARKRRRESDGFGETQWEAPTPEPVCKPRKVEDMYLGVVGNQKFLVKPISFFLKLISAWFLPKMYFNCNLH